MKKILFGLSAVIVAVFVLVMFTNARSRNVDGKQASTEIVKDCGKCPSAASCKDSGSETALAVACDPDKCKELGCDPAKCSEGKCDPATCSKSPAESSGDEKKCAAVEGGCGGCTAR